MKCKIVTLNGYRNFGNRLQLYALSRVLKDFSFKVMVFWPFNAKEELKKVARLFVSKKEYKLFCFSRKYLPSVSRNSHGKVMVVGSDQVWNPEYYKYNKYLLYGGDNDTIISYAASMGCDTIDEEVRNDFRSALRRYSVITVREQSAKDLLQPLTDKRIEVVLDPTLLLDREEYERLEKKPKNLADNEKYILCYILGNRDHEEKIEKFAKEKGYKTIYFSDKRDSDYGVEEFLYLIHHAELICTDSFHACVFSFIFERPFVAFRRTGNENYMYTRLQNLIDTFKLRNREFNGKEISKENLEVDYTEAKMILKKEREKSIGFLKKALEI